MIVKYDKFALWGISHWGKKRRQFYAFATSRKTACDVYSKRQIIAVTKVEIVEWQDYKHLDWITRRVEDLQLGVESYQKKLNLTKPDTCARYQARPTEKHLNDRLNDRLDDVRTALNDRLNGIRMEYLP
ncbi:hypothetical protein Tco_0405191 [Tanacetum coccineum]